MYSKPPSSATWYKAKLNDIENYKNVLNQMLDPIVISDEVLKCNELKCSVHLDKIEELCNEIIHCCIMASELGLPPKAKKRHKKFKNMPGWDEHVAHRKVNALNDHKLWVAAGRPCAGPLFENRKHSRSVYHRAIRRIKSIDHVIRSERMAQAILDNDHRHFWNEVRKFKGKRCTLPVSVDGVKGEGQIADVFVNKYKTLYNSVKYNEARMNSIGKDIDLKLQDLSDHNVCSSLFKTEDVTVAIKCLRKGKSDGMLGVFSDHFIHGTVKLYDLITKLFNVMLIHGMSPSNMNRSVMLPIPKNKRISNKSSDNFRAISLQSVLCKILDIIILNREHCKLTTSELQFGFKSNHSTTLATSVLLETVDYYLNNRGCVYAVSLDATKAFDRVEYTRLFELLIDRNVNPVYTRLILNMYIEQRMCVKYNNTYSDWFSAANGVKQGGVLSPTLFSVYIDSMLNQLAENKVGCFVGDKFCGVVGYADDILLIAPSCNAMRKMIAICEKCAANFDIVFNGAKSKCIVFEQHGKGIIYDPKFVINNQVIETVTELTYLGFKINANRNDTAVQSIINDVNCQVNTLIGDLGVLSSDVKDKLFNSYCTSLYGSNFCDMTDIKKLKVAWRKAIRKLYRLPCRTHSNLLPVITNIIPVDTLIHVRFLKHIVAGLNHDNSVIRTIFRLNFNGYLSRNVTNLLYVCNYYKIDKYKLPYMSTAQIKTIVYQKLYSTLDDNTFRIGCQVQELIVLRDNISNDFILTTDEINSLIEHLCVE